MSSVGSYRELRQHVRQRDFRNLYLLHGIEEGLVAQAEALLRNALLNEQAEDLRNFNTQSIAGSNVDSAQLKDALLAMPMFADRRLVIVNDMPLQPARRAKSRGEESETGTGEEAILAALASCPDSTVVIMTAEAAQKNNWLVKHIVAHGLVYDFPALRREDAQELMTSEATRLGVELERGAALELMNLTGVDGRVPAFRLIKSELAKLAAYVGYSGRVTAQDVTLLVPRSSEAKMWDLTDAVSARDFGRSLRHLQVLWEDGYDAVRVLAGLTSHVSGLLLVRRALADGMDSEEVVRVLGREPYRMHSFPAGKLVSSARQLSVQALSRALDECLELDLMLKTGKREPVLGTEMLLRSLCGMM